MTAFSDSGERGLVAEGIYFSYAPPPPALRWLMGKSRSRTDVLKGVSFRLEGGERVSLMGHNGAGKSTLLKILLGILQTPRGEVLVAGNPPDTSAGRRRIGFVHPEERSFYWRLSVYENLGFFGRLWGLGGPRLSERIGALSESLLFADFLHKHFGDLSSGMRQKIAIARALLHDPAVLFMDEPTRSLDPEASAHFHELLAGPAFEGRTVLMATHSREEAATVSSRCMVLNNGRIEYDGAPPEMGLLLEILRGQA